MSYKDVLVVLEPSARSQGRIEIAAAFAERFGAHLIGLCPLPAVEPGAKGFSLNSSLFSPVYREIREAARQQAGALQQAFDEAARRRGISAEWRGVNEGIDANPAVHARYCDLAILGQLDVERPEIGQSRPEDVAIASGRPILVLPYVGQYETIGRQVLVGWNTSREATRAVADAMPLLEAAETVTVLSIDPREGPAAHGEVPGADISLHLARHGVNAVVERTVSADVPAGQVLLSRAADLGADLLVMGAYGHSRARELLVGGATRSILESMTLPVLMAH